MLLEVGAAAGLAEAVEVASEAEGVVQGDLGADQTASPEGVAAVVGDRLMGMVDHLMAGKIPELGSCPKHSVTKHHILALYSTISCVHFFVVRRKVLQCMKYNILYF